MGRQLLLELGHIRVHAAGKQRLPGGARLGFSAQEAYNLVHRLLRNPSHIGDFAAQHRKVAGEAVVQMVQYAVFARYLAFVAGARDPDNGRTPAVAK